MAYDNRYLCSNKACNKLLFKSKGRIEGKIEIMCKHCKKLTIIGDENKRHAEAMQDLVKK